MLIFAKNINLKLRQRKIVHYFLLILFLGYFVSITSFTHRHIINGIVVVHSHPYNPFNNDKPINHQHSQNGLVVIDLLSHFSTTALLLVVFIDAIRIVLRSVVYSNFNEHVRRLLFLYSNGLRAPPLNIHI